MTNCRSSHPRAFTLLELIISMTMVATLALSLYTSLQSANRAQKSANALVAPIRAVGFAADLICKDLDSVVTPNPALTTAIQGGTLDALPLYLAGEFYGTDNGDSDSVDFYAIGSDGTPGVLNSEGMRHVWIGISLQGNTPALVRRVVRNLLAPTEQEPEEEILCPNVRSFSLRYYDGVETEPYDEWDSSSVDTPNTLPVAIEMVIVMDIPEVNLPNEEPGTYRITRLIPLPCGQPPPVVTQ